MNRTVVVQYRTRDEATAENRHLIEAVFAQLHRERPAGVEYTAYQLDNGPEFVHAATSSAAAALPGLDSFVQFQRDIGARVLGKPEVREAAVIGSYRPVATGVAVAVDFVEAFGKRDMSTVADLLHENVVFESPRTRLTGAPAVLAAITEFSRAVTGVDILDAFGDEERALVCYDMHTGPFGTLRTVDHIVLQGGRVFADTVVFDTSRVTP
ncbi:nuclear transport factor 2 family protein [Nocardia carnea]|uniref:nuclear transport factor 2 family protein n=1 Tax=Nocardia carnea TaxID=37328 RepID=UPI0024554EC5|nr:nuclear transport factor 2 family protein [Nocardia carnea]